MAAARSIDSVISELTEVLEGNGNIPQSQRDRLMLVMIGEIYRGLYGEGGLAAKVEANERTIAQIKPVVEILKWVGGAIGAAILALLWAIATGQATLIFAK